MHRTIHAAQHHWRWDNRLPPALTIAPGDRVEVATLEASGGQLHERSAPPDAEKLDFGRVNPVTGPIFVDGAEPGDALRISIESVITGAWGWTAIIPGFGLLADDFPEPALQHWSLPAGARGADLAGEARIPLKPMVGSIGTALARPGAHDILPPRRVGGTMDIRDLGAGTELYLPVEVVGALVSLGDGHAAQGDGEVCGTGIETALTVLASFDLVKQANLPSPEFITTGPAARHLDGSGFYATTGIGPSLMSGAIDAVRHMIDLLMRRHGLSAEQAYMLGSLCGDLRISEIVDRPNWVVSFYVPRLAFE